MNELLKHRLDEIEVLIKEILSILKTKEKVEDE